jgi:putative flippase GtrA/SAM-dependent methyltransferase
MISGRFLRFIVSGAIAALVNFGSRIVFSLWLPYPAAIVLAWLTGLTSGFLLMRRFAFNDATNQARSQIAWFIAVNLFALLQTLVISLVTARLILPSIGIVREAETIAHAVGVLVPVVTSYFGHKHFSFRRVDKPSESADEKVNSARRAVAAQFVSGNGIEVGAGSRPFPIPQGTVCFYGDVRDKTGLAAYFGTDEVSFCGKIDAQTLADIPPSSLDFIISAHVIEHLFDPLGSIAASIARIKPGGVMLLVVPEMTKTWDCRRPPTTLAHAIADSQDAGEGTRLQAYLEHARYVHPQLTGNEIPEEQIEADARAVMAAGMDVHVHAWREQDFRDLLDYASPLMGFFIAASLSVANENIFVLRKQ